MSALLAWVYVLLYPGCTVSVYDAKVGPYGEYIALPDYPQTWSTCGGQWPRAQREFGRDILVQVCECRP